MLSEFPYINTTTEGTEEESNNYKISLKAQHS